MARKVSYEEFCKRFKIAHSECNVTFENYTAISKPVDIICNICGKKHHYTSASRAIVNYNCCENNVSKFERVKKWIDNNKDFEFVSKINSEYFIVKHLKCGNQYKRNIQKFFISPDTCPFCNTKSKRIGNSIEEAQENLDKIFFGQIKLLNYTGRHSKCTYRCMKCGQIFTQKYDCLLGSSGCPKCDRRISQGEKKMKHILEEANVPFDIQVGVDELPRQHFDFAIYSDVTKNNIIGFIEIQGEQHFSPVKYWGGEEKFERCVILDNKKRKYCKDNNIPLYEIVYKNKKLLNLDILPFLDSTTISVKGSTV